MGKTWKDKPLNVEEVPVYKRRKKSPKPQPEDAEAEMLSDDFIKEIDYWDAWST